MRASCLIDDEFNLRLISDTMSEQLMQTGFCTISHGKLIIARSAIARLFAAIFDRPRLSEPIRFRVMADPALFYNFELSEVPESMNWANGKERGLLFSFFVGPDLPDATVSEFAGAYGLTARERDMLAVVIATGNLRCSAERAGVSYETVRSHMKSIYEKTSFRTLTGVIQAARSIDLSNVP